MRVNRGILDAAVLGEAETLQPRLWKDPVAPCPICQRDIHPGHTCFLLSLSQGRLHHCCWECGDAIAAHLGITTPDHPRFAPPYGGGIPAPRR